MEEINASIETVADLAKTTSNDASDISAISEKQLALTNEVTAAADLSVVKSAELKNVVTKFKI